MDQVGLSDIGGVIASKVIQDSYCPRNDLKASVIIVIEGDELRVDSVEANEAEDAAVIAQNGVRIFGVAFGGEIPGAVSEQVGARTTVNDVCAIRPESRGVQAEEIRAAADNIVLALVSKEGVIAA